MRFFARFLMAWRAARWGGVQIIDLDIAQNALVIEYPQALNEFHRATIRELFQRVLPGVVVIILERGMSLRAVLRKRAAA